MSGEIASANEGAWRDAMGRVPSAPGWAGDVTRLPDHLIDLRAKGLAEHLGRMFTRYDLATGSWIGRTPPTPELEYWTAQRVAALNEQDRRRVTRQEIRSC